MLSTITALGPEPAALRVHAYNSKGTPGGGFDYFHGFRDTPVTVHADKATIDSCTTATMAQPDGAAGKQVLLDATTGACTLNIAPCPGGAVAGPPMCHRTAAEAAAAAAPRLVGGDSFWAILDSGEVYIDGDSGGAAAATTPPQSSCYGFGAWLHHLRSASLERIRKAKPATLYARPGTQGSWDGSRHCGVSFQADAVSSTLRSSIFAKVAVASPDWHDGEMHVREILSYFLDRLLGTFVVPPIAGRLVPLSNVSRTADSQSMFVFYLTGDILCEFCYQFCSHLTCPLIYCNFKNLPQARRSSEQARSATASTQRSSPPRRRGQSASAAVASRRAARRLARP